MGDPTKPTLAWRLREAIDKKMMHRDLRSECIKELLDEVAELERSVKELLDEVAELERKSALWGPTRVTELSNAVHTLRQDVEYKNERIKQLTRAHQNACEEAEDLREEVLRLNQQGFFNLARRFIQHVRDFEG